MARLVGPDMGSRLVYLPSGAAAAGLPGVVYADAGGNTLADIREYQPGDPTTPGASILGSTVATDDDGLLPLFWFPDGLDTVWISVNGGTLTPINADYDRRLDRIDLHNVYLVTGYGATADGSTDDFDAILAAIEDARAAGGTVYFPAGTYILGQTLPIYSNVDYIGSGVGATVLRLAAGANVDLLATDNFASLYSGSTQAGPSHWSLQRMSLDGNGAAQTGTSWPLSTYGSCFRVDQVEISGGKSGGWRSKWGTGGSDMEALISNFKIRSNGGDGLDWQGPHDSSFVSGMVSQQAGHNGILTHGNAGGERFTAVHVWGFHAVGMYFQATATCANCTSEGAQVNVWLAANGCLWDGEVFGTNGTGTYGGAETGVRLGSSGSTKWGSVVRGVSWNWAATDTPIDFVGDNGSTVDVTLRAGSVAAAYAGTPSPRSRVNIVGADNAALTVTEPLNILRAIGFVDNAVESGLRVIDGSYTATSGRINLSYVTAYRTQTITQIGAATRSTAVVGLTAARWGIYAVAANGDLTLVARTAQVTSSASAYGATFTEYVTALSTTGGFPASYTLVAGRQYAFAQIVTFTTTAPVLRGYATNAAATLNARAPRICGLVGAQTDLLATIAHGSVVSDGNAVYLIAAA